jgi:2-polyprenyl-6-methoxyphenol hydroxylase-like FAD-dependent oxidoreductase
VVQSADGRSYDVVILGGGLAGLALARQLLLQSDKRILLVDRRELPPRRQKVGEATVQCSGYYYGKVLDMQEHLLCEHYMKYNLRFYWPSGRGADGYEHCSQSYIRSLSNIVTYQIDRNKFEAELLRVNRERPQFDFLAPVSGVAVDLAEDGGAHRVRFRDPEGRPVECAARWVVDASGRDRVLARNLDLQRHSPVRHGSTFCWVEGLVDFERFSDRTPQQVRVNRQRAALGHTPALLATNHFCGEGFWFWVIPLHGKTSLGLVYDSARVPYREVMTAEGMIDWVCRRYPLFARDLKRRRIVDRGGYASFAHDSAQTLSERRFALIGEACRFADPLYSPGGDLISLYNTMVTDAILTEDDETLSRKVRLYESLARAFYEAYLPSFAVSYDTLGDQEAFSLRYIWELSIYFALYVFPFINDLFTDPTFATGWLRRFGRLGAPNRALHRFLNGYYHWKKTRPREPGGEPVFLDFMESGHLRAAEQTFYKMDLGSEESRRVLDEQVESLEELARSIVAGLTHVVTGDRRALSSAFVEGIDFETLEFDPQALAARVAALPPGAPEHRFKRDPVCLKRFHAALREAGASAPEPAALGARA